MKIFITIHFIKPRNINSFISKSLPLSLEYIVLISDSNGEKKMKTFDLICSKYAPK